jgi:exodeoxyribonuclease VII small subunit
MKNFEERLEKLESLGEAIRRPDLPLDDALKAFEDGIRLARSLEKDLEKVEGRIEILINGSDDKVSQLPEMELFVKEE